jgi:hypothetical protein
MIGVAVMEAIGGANPQGWSLVAGTIAGVLAGILSGLANGILITQFRLQPFIVTLGTMSFFRGVALVMKDGLPINVADYKYLGEGVIMGAPVSVVIFAVVIAFAMFVLKYTPLGRYTYAIGSNREAAFHAGVKVERDSGYDTGEQDGIGAADGGNRGGAGRDCGGGYWRGELVGRAGNDNGDNHRDTIDKFFAKRLHIAWHIDKRTVDCYRNNYRRRGRGGPVGAGQNQESHELGFGLKRHPFGLAQLRAG